MLHATLHTEACQTRVEHANDIHVLIKCERENVRIGLKNAKMKSPSRPHGFALWICLVDLPCASTLPSLPTCPPCPMYPSCAQSVPALNVSRLLRADGQEFAARTRHADTRHADTRHADTRHADTTHDTHSDESRSQTDKGAKTRRACTEQRHADARYSRPSRRRRCSFYTHTRTLFILFMFLSKISNRERKYKRLDDALMMLL
jgi:hypothetical protein